MATLLLYNIGTLATPLGDGPARGEDMLAVEETKNAAVLMRGEHIAGVYADGALPELPADAHAIDAGGRLVTPGLIDSHTHLVFGGWRQAEAVRRVRGDAYMDILLAGGGILDTVRRTREADTGALFEKGRGFIQEMLAHGTTACEIKSGYGLDIDTEEKQLRVACALGEATPMEVVTTYLGAHAVPPEYAGRTDAYVDFLVEEAVPRIAADKLADFCDVFCEEGIFDIAQSGRILRAAMAHGMPAKMHADEIVSLGGGALAADLGAVSADHLIAVSGDSIRALSGGNTVATLLPQTSLYLGKPFAPARRLIEQNVPVALASDFNPGSCPSCSLQLAMNLGFLKYGMMPREVLTAVTRNAACAIGRGASLGTIEPGKQADMVMWDAEDLDMLCYRMGSNQAYRAIKRGQIL